MSSDAQLRCNGSAVSEPRASVRLARNAIWNLLGYSTPLLMALVSIPLLIKSIGADRYGVLTIVWGVIGYFTIFDLGLDGALTKLIAELLGSGREAQIRQLFYTCMVLLACSGCCASVALWLVSSPLAYHWLNVPASLGRETCRVWRILAAVLPFMITVACFRGTLAAYQRFDLINKVQIAVGIVSFGGPLLILPFTHSLVPIVLPLVGARVGGWLAYLYLCAKVAPHLTTTTWVSRRALRSLLTFGGWISLASATDPLFVYSDRIMLGIMIATSAAAYYATPLDVVVRMWMIPDAINYALFPAYATSLGRGGGEAMILLKKAGNYLFPAMLGPVLFIVLFSRQILTVWISPQFASHSSVVFGWLAIGVFLNSIARIPWTLLIANRPDLPAKLVVFEAPVYLVAVYLLIGSCGIEGAAVAWAGRMGINCLALHCLTWCAFPESHTAVKKNAVMMAISLALLIGGGMVPEVLAIRLLYLAAVMGTVCVVLWCFVLSPQERSSLVSVLDPA